MVLRVDDDVWKAVTDWCAALPDPGGFLLPSQAAARTRALGDGGWWTVWQAGRASSGQPILALSSPAADGPVIAAYGYPHPDEPSGATALLMLAEALAHGHRPPGLEDAEWHLILCADPDQAAFNEPWIRAPSVDSYLTHHWRPLYQGLEVDYHFPIDHPPLLQPRTWAPENMPRPLPESLAIADMLAACRPDVLGLMHGNHASGVYTFLSHRPHGSLVDAFDRSTAMLGGAAHLGERPDPGRRWQTARPDLLKERRLADRLARVSRMFGDIGQRRIVGCVPVAMYMESLRPDCVTVTPEIGLLCPERIDDLSPVADVAPVVRVSAESTRKGVREAIRGAFRMPDGTLKDTLLHMRPVPDGTTIRTRQTRMPLTRGMAGVMAVEHRRFYLRQADILWEQYRADVDLSSRHGRERDRISVPAALVNDHSMLIFRTDAGYRRTATEAQWADLRIRWGMQTCLWLAHGVALYAEQGLSEAAVAQQAILDHARSFLLGERTEFEPVGRQARSQLVRLLLCGRAVR